MQFPVGKNLRTAMRLRLFGTFFLTMAACAAQIPGAGKEQQSSHPAAPAASRAVASAETRPATSRAAHWFEAHRHRPPMLRAFLQRMPKGGDLHSHLSGAVYAESYLEWAASENFCVDLVKKRLTPCAQGDQAVVGTQRPEHEQRRGGDERDLLRGHGFGRRGPPVRRESLGMRSL